MKTLVFDVGGLRFRSHLMNAYDQWRLARQIELMLPAIDNASRPAFNHGPMTLDGLLSSFAPMAKLSDDHAAELLSLCLNSCELWSPAPPVGGWHPVASDALDLAEALKLMAHVVMHNLGPLYALERPNFVPTGEGASYEPVQMPDGADWLYRPVMRGFCHFQSLHDGTLHIEDFARMNGAIDVAEENERRAIRAAEKQRA